MVGMTALLIFMFYRLLYGSPTGEARLEIEQWARQNGMEIVRLKRCGRPPYDIAEQFHHTMGEYSYRYFSITAIDPDHVRCSGVSRVSNHPRYLSEQEIVDVLWLTFEQLNWRDRPPRHFAELPPDRAEGWYTDHTGAHELRWYSVGTPTDLVKDGSVESRDPPGPLAEFLDSPPF